MIYETIGKEINCGFELPIYYEELTCFNEKPKEECFRLLLIEQGSGIICFQEHSINFAAPTLLCINEKDFPLFKNCPDTKIKSIYFYPYLINPIFSYKNIREVGYSFSIAERQDYYLLSPFIHRDNHYKGQLSLGTNNNFSRVSKLFEYIGRELQQQRDEYWPCRSRSYFLELLILIIKLFDSNQEFLVNNLTFVSENVENIVNYLHNNYEEKITLEKLAIMFNTNRTTLNDQFYKATNFSVIEYLINLRVNFAATLLRDTLLPVSEIMLRVGFNDNAHFWRTFKKHTKLSPKEYREHYCWVKD